VRGAYSPIRARPCLSVVVRVCPCLSVPTLGPHKDRERCDKKALDTAVECHYNKQGGGFILPEDKVEKL